MSANDSKVRFFVTPDGQNVAFTFALISSLFLLWGFCNGMIDVMDKHFQGELNLTLSQSAWVQFAHYLGYFLMSIPAGWLASKLGYKGGIIAGLLLVAAGGFWFVPATEIARFWAYLFGIGLLASGLTFLETVANPYTTVLGDPKYAASRINLAQSCNGIGWIFGPIAGSIYFYSTDAAGKSTGSQTLWIPYAGIGVVVLVLAAVFYFAPMPDIRGKDDYEVDAGGTAKPSAGPDRQVQRGLVYVLLLTTFVLLAGSCGMILWLILSTLKTIQPQVESAAAWLHRLGCAPEATPENSAFIVVVALAVAASLAAALLLIPKARRISHHSIWSHPHFLFAVDAQFFYVAAQAGIFSFFINYMTSEMPPLTETFRSVLRSEWYEVGTHVQKSDVLDLRALTDKLQAKSDAVSAFLADALSPETRRAMERYRNGTADDSAFLYLLVHDLNVVVGQDPEKPVAEGPRKGEKPEILAEPRRFEGVRLGADTEKLLAAWTAAVQAEESLGADAPRDGQASPTDAIRLPLLHRMLLRDAYPNILAFDGGLFRISDKFASILVSLGFICFLTGRFTGAGLLKKFAAHRALALYGALNVVVCLLVFFKLGWLSVFCVFASYFFMSIMFPTIFALGIYGLGAGAKKASAYIVMAIMGGAVLPKMMGHVADLYDMSRAFIVPMICFGIVALYGFLWPKLSQADSMHGVKPSGGH